MYRLLSVSLFVSLAAPAALINDVQIDIVGAQRITGTTVSGSLTMGGPFFTGVQGQAVTINYSGAAQSSYGTLRNRVAVSVSPVFNAGGPVPGSFGGVSGASLTRWTDTWTLTSQTAQVLANSSAKLRFQVTGGGFGQVTLTVNGVSAVSEGNGFWNVSVPWALNTPTAVYNEFIVRGDAPAPGSGFNLDFFNTVVLTSVEFLNGGTTSVPFTLASNVGAPAFTALSTEPSSVPEPSTAALLSVAAAGAGLWRLLRR